MVLVTHHTQGSYAAVPLKTLSWSKGTSLKHNGIQFQMISRINRRIKVKHAFPIRPVPRSVCEVKGKPLQISSFKGNRQNNESGDPSSKSTLPKIPVNISILPQDKDESRLDSPTVHEMPVSSTSESKKTISGSQVIRGLFTKWLDLLHTGAPSKTGSDILEEPPQTDHPQERKVANTRERGEILKVVLCYFLGLDASITIPLMIFVPFYLAVNVMYGAEVSRELTPLWVIGPLIVALYVKLFRGIIALYVFAFKQSVKVVKNLPMYYSVAHKYIIGGKLKEEIHARLWQPVANLRNIDYKELSMRKWKVFKEWLMENYLDFVESIWPYYCRTIRFLKRANLL